MPVEMSDPNDGLNHLSSPEEVKFQSLPFTTPFCGTTEVEEEFTRLTHPHESRKREREEELPNSPWTSSEYVENYLRGRRLLGVDVRLPTGYRIAVLERVDAVPPSTHPSLYHCRVSCENGVTAATSRFTLWSHDRPPSQPKLLSRWIALAQTLHTEEGT